MPLRTLALAIAVLGLPAPGWVHAAGPAPLAQRVATRVAQPVIEPARGTQCVAEPAFMRRNHMALLRHDRDLTVRAGVRDPKYSLKACIGCHASATGNSVSAGPTNFCQSCHDYAAVKLDCFECHASRPDAGAMHGGAKQ
jgi:hypothetical protein